MTRVWVSGSLAYDRIMDYPGRFGDHIDPTKTHILNLSFAVPTLQQTYGGTAGNIAYGLTQLGCHCGVVASLGADGTMYLKRLRILKVYTKHVQMVGTLPTAGAYVITDRDDNQITGFVVGAASQLPKPPTTRPGDWGMVAAEQGRNMGLLAKHYASRGSPYVFDPGQALTDITVADLRFCIAKAKVVVSNDYEMSIIARRSRVKFGSDQIIITTLGAQGSLVATAGKTLRVRAAKAASVVDPTGAGDAYRAGLMKGLIEGWPLVRTAQLASVVASYAVEALGTQTYTFTIKEITNRYYETFKEKLAYSR